MDKNKLLLGGGIVSVAFEFGCTVWMARNVSFNCGMLVGKS